MKKRKKIVPISEREKDYFEQFYLKYKKFMYFTARKYAQEDCVCEDIVQECVIRLLNHVQTLLELEETQQCKYIAMTVRTVFLDMEKAKQNAQLVSVDERILEEILQAESEDQESDTNLTCQMEVERLRKNMKARDWVLLEGKYILGYSQEELGEMVGVAPASIRMLLCRAKEQARKILWQIRREDF